MYVKNMCFSFFILFFRNIQTKDYILIIEIPEFQILYIGKPESNHGMTLKNKFFSTIFLVRSHLENMYFYQSRGACPFIFSASI